MVLWPKLILQSNRKFSNALQARLLNSILAYISVMRKVLHILSRPYRIALYTLFFNIVLLYAYSRTMLTQMDLWRHFRSIIYRPILLAITIKQVLYRISWLLHQSSLKDDCRPGCKIIFTVIHNRPTVDAIQKPLPLRLPLAYATY